jgi:hypothetical protein
LNKKPIEKHKIIHEEQDLEIVQKKKKSEAKYGDRLTTLENGTVTQKYVDYLEIAKIKSKEVQVLKSIISTSSLDISSTESSKKIKSVVNYNYISKSLVSARKRAQCSIKSSFKLFNQPISLDYEPRAA